MSTSLTSFLYLLFKFKNKLPVLSRVKLPYILEMSKDITKNNEWVNQLERSLVKCTMHYCLLDVQSVVCSPALLICSISLLRRMSLWLLGPHWPLRSCTGPQHLSMINSESVLCKILLYIICGVLSWTVTLSALSGHESLHKLAPGFSPATCSPLQTSCTHVLSSLSVPCSLCCANCFMDLKKPPYFSHLENSLSPVKSQLTLHF